MKLHLETLSGVMEKSLPEVIEIAKKMGIEFKGTKRKTALTILETQAQIISDAIQGVIDRNDFIKLMANILKRVEQLTKTVQRVVDRVDKFEKILTRYEQDNTLRIRLETFGILSPRDIFIISDEAIKFIAEYYQVPINANRLNETRRGIYKVLRDEGWGETSWSELEALQFNNKRQVELELLKQCLSEGLTDYGS